MTVEEDLDVTRICSIADLVGEGVLAPAQLAEALQYRPRLNAR